MRLTMADDLISRQAAKEAVKYIPWCDWKAVGDCLDELPASDAVKVVRCRDCKWYERVMYSKRFRCCKIGGLGAPDADDFCSYGERREGNEADRC